eukprot:11565973-Alexandrium_andersonii.AAC.1
MNRAGGRAGGASRGVPGVGAPPGKTRDCNCCLSSRQLGVGAVRYWHSRRSPSRADSGDDEQE